MKPSCKGSSESKRMDFARLLYTIIFPKAFRQEFLLYVRSFLTLWKTSFQVIMLASLRALSRLPYCAWTNSLPYRMICTYFCFWWIREICCWKWDCSYGLYSNNNWVSIENWNGCYCCQLCYLLCCGWLNWWCCFSPGSCSLTGTESIAATYVVAGSIALA